MSRSYKKNPFTKGPHSSWKWDKTRSARDYRRFVKQKLAHEKYDDIHNRYKIFHDRWGWSPDYFFYMGHHKNPVIGFSQWRLNYEVNHKGRDYFEVVQEILEDKRQEYLKAIRK